MPQTNQFQLQRTTNTIQTPRCTINTPQQQVLEFFQYKVQTNTYHTREAAETNKKQTQHQIGINRTRLQSDDERVPQKLTFPTMSNVPRVKEGKLKNELQTKIEAVEAHRKVNRSGFQVAVQVEIDDEGSDLGSSSDYE